MKRPRALTRRARCSAVAYGCAAWVVLAAVAVGLAAIARCAG